MIKTQDEALTGADTPALIEACLNSNEQAWEILLERYSRLIYTIPLRFGFSTVVADEIFQEICVILLEKLGTVQDRQRLNAWLVTITRRACIQRLRKKENTTSFEMLEEQQFEEEQIEADLLRTEQQDLVRRALHKL